MAGLASLALEVGTNNSKRDGQAVEIADIITFVESSWGLGQKLFPVQRVILKAHYGLALDDNPYGLDLDQPVPVDHPNYHEIVATTGTEKGYYKYRVRISDWRRQTWRSMSEADYLRMLYDEGRSNIREVVPGLERREMILSIGRRSGKTQIASFVAAYETYKLIMKGNPQAYYGLPSGEPIGIISVATDKDQAGILYSKVSGYYKDCSYFAKYTANNTQTYARFQTPRDIDRSGRYSDKKGNTAQATIRITFRPCRAKGLRGPGNLVIILDELAHFIDTGQSSAKEVYDAVTPSTSAFSPKDPQDPTSPIGDGEGRILAISSPLGRQGQFYTLFQIGMSGGEASKNMLCLQAPTWEVNPTVPASEFEKHFLKDPNIFFTEYGGEFTDRTKGWIDNRNDLLVCVDPDRRPATRAPARRPHYVGLDFALAGDGTAIAITHVEGDKIILDYLEEIRAGEGRFVNHDRLDFDDVADWIRALSKRFLFAKGLFDQWAGIVFEQALQKRGLGMLESTFFTDQLSSQIFRNFKDMMWDKRLVLYDWPRPQQTDGTKVKHCPYIEELLELQAEYKSKYLVKVAAPNIRGKHDDMSDALVRSVWQASQHLAKPSYISTPLTRKSPGMGAQLTPTQLHKLAVRARRPGGSSPDRQPSRIRKGAVRGRP